MTIEDVCKAPLRSIWGPNPKYENLPLEQMKTDYAEYCPKSKSNNIIFCPKDIIKRKKDPKIQWLNDWFKDAIDGKIKFRSSKVTKSSKSSKKKKKKKRKKKKYGKKKSKKRKKRKKRKKKRKRKKKYKNKGWS